MKTSARASRPAFTLIELLVVIAIIGILASILLPVLSRMVTKAKVAHTRNEVRQIAAAFAHYESEGTRFPLSQNVMNAVQAVSSAAGGPEDFTFGGTFKTPGGGTIAVTVPGMTYTANNSELMGVLLDMETFPNGKPTINQGHVKNPRRTRYLDPPMVTSTNSPGLGPEGVYRDPWGTPYVITIDLNGDEKARDGFYRDPNVSADSSDPTRGQNGLIPRVTPAGTFYEETSKVMVWSAGPDKMIEIGPANQGANKDNIMSWK